MENITIGEISAALLALSALVGAIIFLSKPIRAIFSDVKRLNLAVFGEENKNNVLATKDDMTELSNAITKLTNATNLMYNAIVATIETMPENETLAAMKVKLNEHNGIV